MKKLIVLSVIFVSMAFVWGCREWTVEDISGTPPVTYDADEGTVYIPNATILILGVEYWETAPLADTGLALVLIEYDSDTSFFFYSPLIGDLDSLTLDASNEAFVEAMLNALGGGEPETIEGHIQSVDFTLKTGIHILELGPESAEFTNQLHRWAAVERVGHANDTRIIIPTRWFKLDYVELLSGNFDDFVQCERNNSVDIQCIEGDDFNTYGSIAKTGFLGLVRSGLDQSYRQAIVDAHNANSGLFSALNQYDMLSMILTASGFLGSDEDAQAVVDAINAVGGPALLTAAEESYQEALNEQAVEKFAKRFGNTLCKKTLDLTVKSAGGGVSKLLLWLKLAIVAIEEIQSVRDEVLYMPYADWTAWSGAEEDTYEPNNSFSQAYGNLLFDLKYESFLWSESDVDYYYFNAGSKIVGDVTIKLASLPHDYNVVLYDQGQREIGRSENTGTDDEQIIAGVSANQDYFIHVFSPQGDYDQANTYLLEITYSGSHFGVISGYVYDQVTDEGIPGATVSVDNKPLQAQTNDQGFYRIPNVPVGFYTLTASCSGYQSQQSGVVSVIGDKEVNQDFYLTPTGGGDIEWIQIPAGWFIMGSSDSDDYAYYDEKPQHNVYLDGYYISKYEVTNAQYKAFCDATGHPYPPDPGVIGFPDYFLNYPNYPVLEVSWDDAKAFCEWVGGRLPTEAEWEKAARGTDGRIYPWGNDLPTLEHANYGAFTEPVGSYPLGASPYGCLDMAGNVWEWCNDWYDAAYYQNSPDHNPAGPPTGDRKVVRGNSWGIYSSPRRELRCANRQDAGPLNQQNDIGFRPVRG